MSETKTASADNNANAKIDDRNLSMPIPRTWGGEPIIPEPIIVPSIQWTNDQLGEFAYQLGKRNAIDVWRLGRAIKYVHERTKHGEWGVWQAKYLPYLSERTISRYEKVGNLLYDDVKDVNLDQIYRNLFGEDYASPKQWRGKAVRADQGEKKGEKVDSPKNGGKPEEGGTVGDLTEGDLNDIDQDDLDVAIEAVSLAIDEFSSSLNDDQRAKLRTLYGKLAEMFA